jgi:hypothetical protein
MARQDLSAFLLAALAAAGLGALSCGEGSDVVGSGTGAGAGNGTGSGGAAGDFKLGNPGAAGSGTSGGTPGAAGKSGGSTTGPDNTCGIQRQNLAKLPGELLLVLDRSGSMAEPFASAAGMRGAQKWTEVTGALDQVIMRTQAGILWGLKLYPVPNACGVPPGVTVPVAANNYGPIMDAIRASGARINGGATPTSMAMKAATAALQVTTSKNPRFILLATDGLPNCLGGSTAQTATDAPGAIASVAEAAAAGFPVFVVGIATAGTDAHATLNEMAQKGGKPRNDPMTKYFPVQNRDEFLATLEAIAGQVSSCTFQLNGPPPDANSVAVNVDGMRIQRDNNNANGWSFNAGNTSITIYGPVCEKLKSGMAKNVEILLGCKGIVIP